MALLEGRNLRKTYRLGRRNSVAALRGVDISIERGEMVAIMGPSGSGKSTLMHILGLAPRPRSEPRPRSRADVRRPRRRSALRRRAHPAPGPRDGLRLPGLQPGADPQRSGERHAGRRRTRASRRHRRRQPPSTRSRSSGLAERADHRPAELSGGEQQRVAIARALVNRPALVLADEPTGNLDSERSAEVLALLRQFNREQGQTFILVTHDAEVGEACDRVVRMRDGKIRDHGLSVVRSRLGEPRVVAASA